MGRTTVEQPGLAEQVDEARPAVIARPTGRASTLTPRSWSLWPSLRPIVSCGVELGADVLALYTAWRLSGYLRLALSDVLTPMTAEQLARVVPPFGLVVVLWALARLAVRGRQFINPVFGSRVEAIIIVSLVIVVFAFLARQSSIPFSRGFVLIFGPLGYVMLVLFGSAGQLLLRHLHRGLAPAEACVVVGAPENVKDLVERLQKNDAREVRAIGVVVPEGEAPSEEISGLRVLASTKDLAAVINREGIERIIIDDSLPAPDLLHCKAVATRMGVVLTRIIGLDGPDIGVRWEVERRYGMTAVSARVVELTQWQLRAKRALDLVIASVTLIVLAPLMLLIALAVKLTSPGPCLYVAPRVGRGGRYFSFLKFRTMYVDQCRRDHVAQQNEKNGHIFKLKHDPRVTPLGRILRRFSLDELPQLINVIRGDMSLVGPRPLPAEDLDPDGMSQEFRYWAETRAKVRPGITGLWQVRGRSELSFEQMVELDIEYVENWSLWRDLEILLVTPLVVLTGRGAY